MKKVEQSKIASSRPSYQTSEMVASRMADLESEKFKAAKQITELEQEIASLERDIVQLKEKNFLLDHEANSLDLKYQLMQVGLDG
jgi:predicted RNase H-like nuclease (RuvC/YqgF family)